MRIHTLVVGPIMANCFIMECPDTQKAAVIDPGADSEAILSTVRKLGLTVTHIINTHGHFDHVGANAAVKAATQAPILIHMADAPMLAHLAETAAAFGLRTEDSPPPDRAIDEGDLISVGNITLRVLHTPGHTLGGVSLYADGHLFVGDTLFAGSVGRTDFPGGDFSMLKSSIRNKLFPLGDTVQVHTGHGPDTTIGRERRSNPFVSDR